MKVLIGCEFSAVVRDAFRERGHDAWSCDLLPCERDSRWHIQGDVLKILGDGWDLAIFHPPCTYLALSGVQHLHKRPERWGQMRDGREFFLKLLEAPIAKRVIENPLPHSYAELPKYSQIIQPYMFGHETQKRTCLWLRGLPSLTPTNIVGRGEVYMKDGKSNGAKWYHYAAFNKDRWKIRSRTFQGIAAAMAAQWGNL